MDARLRRILQLALFAAAVVGTLAGIWELALHLSTDPLADVHAYYDAGRRLNAGLPLYPAGANPDAADFYRYPPLLAILFRPLAVLPFAVAALLWETLVVAAFVLTLRRLGLRRPVFLALGILALPTAWALTIGQAQVVVTLLLAIAAPWSIALAAQLKVTPALAVLFWLGRRDLRALVQFAGWSLALVALQVVLAPRASLDFIGTLTVGQVGHVNNWSPFVASPVAWAVLLAAAVVAVVGLARTRYGWAAAVAISILATPRLLTYMFGSLLAGLARPLASETVTGGRRRGVPESDRA